MKLLKCYVFSFGKLNDLTFDFESGLNTFKEDNGWGKSTLASFIKAVFYGLNDSKRSVAENERIKFKPWKSNEKFGGYIEFEWGGKEFKLERFFGNKASEDTVKLVDLNTGRAYPNTENLGSRIFQIDEEGFLSTTYFSQKDFQIKSNTSLTAKFNSVCEIQDNEAFDKALTKLEEKAKTYKYRGDKGLIADAKREIFDISQDIQRASLAEKTAQDLRVGVKALEREVEQLKDKTTELTSQVAQAGKAEAMAIKKAQLDAYAEKKKEYVREKNQLESTLNGQRPSETEISAYIDCVNELNKVSVHESVLASDIRELQNQPISTPKKKINKIGLTLAIIASLLVVAGLAMLIGGFTLLIPSLCSIGVGVVTAIISLIISIKGSRKTVENNSENSLLEQKLSSYNEYKAIRERYENNIDGFLNKFIVDKTDRFSCLNVILEAVKRLAVIEKEISLIDKYIGEFSAEELAFKDKTTQDLGELRKRLFEVQEEYSRKAKELASRLSDIKLYQDKADALPDLEDKKAEVSARREQYIENYEILMKTLEFLTKADENLKVKYRAPLQQSLNKYLSLITGNKKTAQIDIDLNVTVLEQGVERAPDYYSKGEQNLFEICKRFALTDVLFTGEKPFIILDDPFYNLDDEKLKISLELIRKLAEEYQILYFVCHESRRA